MQLLQKRKYFSVSDFGDWEGADGSGSSLFYTVGAAATLGAMGLWWMWSSRPSPKKLTPLVDPESQTRILPVN
jgi:hypothetical protein